MLLLQKLFSCQEPRLSLPIKQKFVCLKCQSIKYYNKLKWTLVSTSMILKIYLQRTRMSHNGFKKKELSIYLKKIFQKLRYYINEVTFCGQSVDGSLCEMFSARCIKSPLSVNQWFVAFWSVWSAAPRRGGWCLELETNLSKDITIMEVAPTRAISWLKVPSSTLTFKNLC